MERHKLADKLVEFYDKMSSWEVTMVKKRTDLTPAQMHAIEVIGTYRTMKMCVLAARLGITTGTLSIGIDKLEKKGLVVRKPHETDGRSLLIVLTEQGQKIFEQHHRFHYKFTEEIVNDLPEEEIEQFMSTLSKIVVRM